jgi:hypothetical protein
VRPDRHFQQALLRLGEIFGDEVVAAAMIDRLVHHAEILSLKGDSYRLKDKDLGRATPAARVIPALLAFGQTARRRYQNSAKSDRPRWVTFRAVTVVRFSTVDKTRSARGSTRERRVLQPVLSTVVNGDNGWLAPSRTATLTPPRMRFDAEAQATLLRDDRAGAARVSG